MDLIMKNMFFLFTALLGLSLSTAIKADEGPYAGIIAGANWINETSHKTLHNHVRVDYKTGYLVGATLGWTWCNNFSLEAEFAYRKNNVDHVKFKDRHHDGRHNDKHSAKGETTEEATAVAANEAQEKGNNHGKDCNKKKKHSSHGYLNSYAIMANARYDFCIDSCFTPYVKGGIGYANSKNHHNKNHDDKVCHKGDNCDNGKKSKHCHNSHSKNGFAWQVGAGVTFPICDNTTFDIGYTYFRAQKEINNQSLVFAAKYGF